MKCRDRFKVRIETLDASSSDVGRYNYIQIGNDGNPIIMYVDESNGWMKVLHCGTNDCSLGSRTITVIDEIGISAYGEFPEMQINPISGFAVLSYFNQTNSTSGAVKVAQCVDITCSQAIVQVIGVGKCGYGRDSSLTFSTESPYYVYVSFMNYSPIAKLRKTSLAVLTQVDENNSSFGEYYILDHERLIANSKMTPRDIDDICQLI